MKNLEGKKYSEVKELLKNKLYVDNDNVNEKNGNCIVDI